MSDKTAGVGPVDGSVRPIALMVACFALAACGRPDVSADEPLTTTDVGVLAAACSAHGGMKRAERVRPMFKHREWRIDCADGARFVLPAA